MTGARTKKLFLPLAAAAAVLAGLAGAQSGSSASAQAASHSGPTTCSMSTLDATYVFSGQGEVQVSGSTTSVAVAGIQTFDGRGHAHGFYSQSLNGKILKRIGFTATYTLNPDCTGTHTATDATGAVWHTDQYSLPSGTRVMFLGTDPGAVFSGTGVTETMKVD